MQCYIGPCGVLVPTGTMHSNNEFEFEFEFEFICTSLCCQCFATCATQFLLVSDIYMGLAHGLLDSPWKKLVYGKTLFSDTVTPALSTDSISQEQLTGQLLQLLESQKE